MSERTKKAVENHRKGYNCCQAVACALCDLTGIEETTMFKMTEGFGTGMGCMEATCGAISGAVTILGLMHSSANLNAPDSKANTYRYTREVVKAFQEKNQAIRCKDLKGIETKQVLRSCPGCVEDAAEILEKLLLQE